MNFNYILKDAFLLVIFFSLPIIAMNKKQMLETGENHALSTSQNNTENMQSSNTETTEPRSVNFCQLQLEIEKSAKELKEIKKAFLQKTFTPNELKKMKHNRGKVIHLEYHEEKAFLYQDLATNLCSAPQSHCIDLIANFIKQQNELLREFMTEEKHHEKEIEFLLKSKNNNIYYNYKKAILYTQIKYMLVTAFCPSSVSLSTAQKEWILLRGIKSNQLKEAFEGCGRIIAPCEQLNVLVQPLLSAVQLQSIRCIYSLYNRNEKTNARLELAPHVSWGKNTNSPIKVAQMIVNNPELEENRKKAQAILLMLEQIQWPVGGNDLPRPWIIIESREEGKVPSLLNLCAKKCSEPLFKHILDYPQTTLSELKNKEIFKNSTQDAQSIILKSLHARINYFEPELLRQLTLKESFVLKKFWDKELDKIEGEEFYELFAKHRYTGEIMQKLPKLNPLYDELNQELGLYKKE